MTKDDLEKMGVVYVGSKFNPNRFFIPHVGEVTLYEPYRYEDVLQKVYDSGYENGVRDGMFRKICEIKSVLGIKVT
jgi:hypothetical protein